MTHLIHHCSPLLKWFGGFGGPGPMEIFPSWVWVEPHPWASGFDQQLHQWEDIHQTTAIMNHYQPVLQWPSYSCSTRMTSRLKPSIHQSYSSGIMVIILVAPLVRKFRVHFNLCRKGGSLGFTMKGIFAGWYIEITWYSPNEGSNIDCHH